MKIIFAIPHTKYAIGLFTLCKACVSRAELIFTDVSLIISGLAPLLLCNERNLVEFIVSYAILFFSKLGG